MATKARKPITPTTPVESRACDCERPMPARLLPESLDADCMKCGRALALPPPRGAHEQLLADARAAADRILAEAYREAEAITGSSPASPHPDRIVYRWWTGGGKGQGSYAQRTFRTVAERDAFVANIRERRRLGLSLEPA